MWPILLAIILVILVVAYRRATRYYGSLEKLGIPVIKPFLCFGSYPLNYHEIKFHELDMQWYHELGKPKAWGYYEGHVPTITVTDPAMLKTILVKEFDAFRNRFTTNFEVPSKYLSLDSTGEKEWKPIRKFLSSTFTTGRIKAMVQPIEHQVDRLLEHIRGHFGDSNSAIIEFKTVYQSLTIDVIAKCAFGIEINSLQPKGIDKSNKLYKAAIDTFAAFAFTDRWTSYFFLFGFYMFPDLMPVSMSFPTGTMDSINSTTASVIKKRDELKMDDQGDFIDRLRMMIHKIRESGESKFEGLDEEMVVAQGIIFLAAGFETTANTLGSLTYIFAKHPEIQQRCFDEIEEVIANKKEINHETISELHYLEACIKENLRLNSPVFRNQRNCSRDVEVDGLKIKKGWNIMIPTYILHRNPDIFGENPDQFIPERFLNDGMKEQVDNFLFHAFGGGPRICIGMRFAMEEMKITLAKILTNFVIIDEPNVTKLEFQKGNIFLLSYPEMKVRIKERN